MNPAISIITPTLNAVQTLNEALSSTVSQLGLRSQPDVEHLIIDAVSGDGTLGITDKHPHLTVISESDRGIYDGMNKGAHLARGEWLLFLQADDFLPEGTLAAYTEAIRANPGAEMLCGDAEAIKISAAGCTLVWAVNDPMRKKLTVENIVLGEPMINARLIRRDVFLRLGGFSLEYSLASDRDFLLRAAVAGIRQVELPSLTYRYRWHSGSSTMTEGNRLSEHLSRENLCIARKYLTQIKGDGRVFFKKWHSRLQVQAAMNALESLGMGRLLTSAKEGTTVDPSWPLQFAMELIGSLPGFLARGGKTRSRLLKENKFA